MKTLLMLAIATLSLHAVGQTTGSASSVGVCNINNTGHSTNLVLQCGIGKDQGKALLRIVNEILTHQLDTEKVMKKIDELIAEKQPAIEVHCDNNEGNCAGINNGQQVTNKYDSPHINITTDTNVPQPASSTDGHPRASARFFIDAPWPSGTFAIKCDRPCHSGPYSVCGIPGFSQSSWGSLPGYPNLAAILFGAQFPAGYWCTTTVESEDTQPIKIIAVEMLIAPRVPAK